MKNFLKNITLSMVLVSIPLCPSWVQNPQDLQTWYLQEFTYQSEEEGQDYWKTPEETLRDKGGDCEDMAFLSQKILKQLGYTSHILIMTNKENGHAICVFQEKNKTFSVMDVRHYRAYNLSSWQEIVEQDYNEYTNIYVCISKDKCQELYKGE